MTGVQTCALPISVEADCNVHGVELVTELIRPFCNTFPQFRQQIYSDKFQDVAICFPDKYFDLITAIDVVEHFEAPLSDLCGVYRILKDDGVFIIQTPDIDCDKAKTLGCQRSEEHTSELQSHSFISYAVFCLKKKNNIIKQLKLMSLD